MKERHDEEEVESVDELVIRNAYELTALLSLLERKGVLTRAEMIEEIRNLEAKN